MGTRALIAVQQAGIQFRTHEYVHDPKAASYGLEAAEALGIDPARVFKTLVATVDGKFAVGLVPVERSLDLKAFASALGAKKANMSPVPDAERVTGYVAGGISPIAQKKLLPTVIDESALQWQSVFISAGRRGLEIELDPKDLCKLSNARFATIAR